MREKLNESPAAQIGLVVILVAVAGFMLLSKSGGGEESAPTEATVTVAGTGATGIATGATPGEALEGAIENAATVTSPAALATSLPTPPMPPRVAAAYDADEIVVLLVVHPGGIDDRLSMDSVERLRGLENVALFIVPASRIARYAAITLGADVQRVPALVVMKPRSRSDGVPQASVEYGFRTAQSVVQAVVDAGYRGPEVTYHPG